MSKSLTWGPSVGPRSTTLRLAARVLRRAGHALDRLARRGRSPVASATTQPLFEYHAEAGAPEGALYVDGRLVGHLSGVNRL